MNTDATALDGTGVPLSGRFYNRERSVNKSRHKLPHWQQADVLVFATWRLADSLPYHLLKPWQDERTAWCLRHPKPWDQSTENDYHRRFSRKIDQWLDQGIGSCVLRDPRASRIVADTLLHFDGERHETIAFVVMPNHVHVLFRPNPSFGVRKVLNAWKGFSAKEINRTQGTHGRLWQPDYWDRLIRSERHLAKCLEYIQDNPKKAHLRNGEFVLYEKK